MAAGSCRSYMSRGNLEKLVGQKDKGVADLEKSVNLFEQGESNPTATNLPSACCSAQLPAMPSVTQQLGSLRFILLVSSSLVSGLS
eukprot:3932992-Rhodomonas_salina.1